jgi:hypothetical protein
VKGVVGSVQGSASSNVTIYNSIFEAGSFPFGISGSNTGTTLGGVVYIESANAVEIENNTFKQILSVGSGGVLYISSGLFVNIKGNVFNQIAVSVSGGYLFLFFSYVFYRYYYCGIYV